MPPKKEGTSKAGAKGSGRGGGGSAAAEEKTTKTYSITAVRCSECNGDLSPEPPAGSKPGTPIELFCKDHGARRQQDEILVTRIQFFSDSEIKVEGMELPAAQ